METDLAVVVDSAAVVGLVAAADSVVGVDLAGVVGSECSLA